MIHSNKFERIEDLFDNLPMNIILSHGVDEYKENPVFNDAKEAAYREKIEKLDSCVIGYWVLQQSRENIVNEVCVIISQYARFPHCYYDENISNEECSKNEYFLKDLTVKGDIRQNESATEPLKLTVENDCTFQSSFITLQKGLILNVGGNLRFNGGSPANFIKNESGSVIINVTGDIIGDIDIHRGGVRTYVKCKSINGILAKSKEIVLDVAKEIKGESHTFLEAAKIDIYCGGPMNTSKYTMICTKNESRYVSVNVREKLLIKSPGFLSDISHNVNVNVHYGDLEVITDQ